MQLVQLSASPIQFEHGELHGWHTELLVPSS